MSRIHKTGVNYILYLELHNPLKQRHTRNTHTENSNLFMADSPYFSDGIYVCLFDWRIFCSSFLGNLIFILLLLLCGWLAMTQVGSLSERQ